jgi:KDO2-lipid IV(A) lauroyltransferase
MSQQPQGMPPAIAHAPSRRRKSLLDIVLGSLMVGLFRLMRLTNRKRLADLLGALMRRVGPWLPEHRVGRANLAAAFPDKSAMEIETILGGVWENLGRVAAEFAHLDRLRILDFEQPTAADVTYEKASFDRFLEIRRSGRGGIFFAGHLANWEIPALAAAFYKMDTAVLYRRPNIRAVSDAVVKMRAGCMGTLIPSGLDAPVRLAHALEHGKLVGMLVDQHVVRGVDVTFFGRRCRANPLLAQLARHLEAPIRGVRVVRRPDGNSFWGELTEPIEPVRDGEGRIDVQGTTQAIASVLESWVREHPEQWLWLHRRWR